MRKSFAFLKLILITIVCILVSTFLTYKNDLRVDGCVAFGFPFSFYESCADPAPGYEGGYKITYLILDVFIIFSIVLLFTFKQFFKIKK